MRPTEVRMGGGARRMWSWVATAATVWSPRSMSYGGAVVIFVSGSLATALAQGLCRSLLVLALLSGVVGAASAQTLDAVEQAWRSWMSQHGRTTGSLAILHGGRTAREAAAGREAVGEAVPVASLSKAVTGVCIAGLIESGRLSFETPLSQALSRTFGRIGRPADPRLAAATIGELLSHRAGFGPGTDAANGPLAGYLLGNTARRTAFDTQLRWVIGRQLPLAPGERYAYSNAAYLILGAVIEEASGHDYESFCRQTVLLPLGARNAGLDPAWRILSSYGGWFMPIADYGRFYQAFAPDNPAIGPRARAWMMSPEGKQVGGGVHYGLGTFVRPARSGAANFWHWGAWSYELRGAYDGPLSASYSAFAVRWGASDTNLVAHFAPRLEGGGAQNDFDRTMGAAVGAVKAWP
jgi:CubicO group peptidase (beta-lactamase class C family)